METFEKLEGRIVKCYKCSLATTAKRKVPGSGNKKAHILFVGEAPGKKEDETGEPFVGTSGKILNELLDSISISRSEIFIANIVKCRPPKNRDPSPSEIILCKPWLLKQISLIQPKVIVTLGRHSLKIFLGNDKNISECHGKNHTISFSKEIKAITIIPLYHPAATIYNKKLKKVLFEDFQKLREFLS
ncbi:MAG: uracil-DNA glycosylase [Candidatus Moraniibacteriota bacterium]|nr:MAG: uracil-DNA glycosylase [Candidatus Moranbacteria bacterium]